MNRKENHIKQTGITSYIVGFFLSIILTTTSFYFVWAHVASHHHMYTHEFLLILIFGLAILQCIIQLIFFLHLTQEKKPRWNFVVFLSTIAIIFIVVIGSIWIMNHLNANMTPSQMLQYVQNQDGF